MSVKVKDSSFIASLQPQTGGDIAQKKETSFIL